MVHAFASRVLPGACDGDSSLQLAASPQSLRRVEGSKAFTQMEQAREKWSRMLPAEDGLWAWCLEQKQGVLLELLAFCAATTINTVRLKGDRPDGERLQHADRLAAAYLKLDIKAWFTPDAANYFSRVSKPQILEALLEGESSSLPAPAWEKAQEGRACSGGRAPDGRGTGWLPALLRPAA